MEAWLAWARGPVFVFSFTFMVLGLIRHFSLTVWELGRTLRRAGDKSLPCRQLCVATLKWLFPVAKVKNQLFFSVTSVAFHICILIVPIFLAGHIALWARSVGISWPAVPNDVADVLTVIAVITAVVLIVQRLTSGPTRALSRLQDYLLPLVIAVPFATGFLLMHPAWNPFPHQALMFVHVMSGNLVLFLLPITKLNHAVLMPAVQWVSEIGWHWPSDSGGRVAVALGKEREPV